MRDVARIGLRTHIYHIANLVVSQKGDKIVHRAIAMPNCINRNLHHFSSILNLYLLLLLQIYLIMLSILYYKEKQITCQSIIMSRTFVACGYCQEKDTP